MYKVYLMTGVFLLLAGLVTTAWLVWFLKNTIVKSDKSVILFLAHGIATAFIGIFYIYSALVMLNNLNDNNLQQIPFVDQFNYGPFFNLTDFNNDNIGVTEEKPNFDEAQSITEEYIEILNASDVDYNLNTNSEITLAPNYTFQDSTKQFLLKYQQFLRDALNKSSYELPVLNRRTEATRESKETKQNPENLYNSTRCSFENIFLQHVMLTYSFVHGLVALINSAIDCKDCKQQEEENTTNDNQEKPSSSHDNSSSNNSETTQVIENSASEENIVTKTRAENTKPPQKYRKLILQLLTILIPPLCASSLYFIMQNQDNDSNPDITKILANPTNISSLENTNEVNNVVRNIYRIIREVKANSNVIIPKLNFHNQNNTLDPTIDCYNPDMFLKIHTFLIFIVGSIVVLLYSQTTYAKLQLIGDPATARNLKMILFTFGTLWLPAGLEMFSRMYLIKDSPNFISELLTALGNLTHILINIGSVLKFKRVAKKQNYVQPVV